MKSMITKRIEKLLHDKKVHKRYLAVFLCLAAVVVFGTVMMLRYSGIAMTHKEKVLTCSYKVHEHKKDCYIKEDGEKVLNCGYADYAVHVHNDDCYDAEGKLVCTLPEIKEHKHDASCYKEERVLTCGKEESEGHKHTDSCYKEEKGDLSCGKEEHKHTDGCYGEDGSLTCGMEEHEHSDKCYEYTKSLKCEKEEKDGHKHDDSCYEKQKVLTCGQLELHTHDKKCYDKNGNLTCGLFQLESHVHSEGCFKEVEAAGNSQEDAGAAGNAAAENNDAGDADPDQAEENNDAGNDENTDTGAEIYTLHEEDEESADAADDDQAEEPSKEAKAKASRDIAGGTLDVTLLYGDKKDHPEGASYFTHSTMSGFIKLEPKDLPEDLTDVTVTLKIPKQYVEKDTVNIPRFSTNSDITKYTIPDVRDDDAYYYADINFSAYDKTQTLVLPFALSFKDDVVPDNYELPVTATVTRNDGSDILDETEDPLIYKPEYKEWGITKFVNSNKNDAYMKDGAEVVVRDQDEDKNPYLNENEYVEFYFRVNRVTNTNADLKDYRDASEVTLTDTLPSYEKTDGTVAIAVFVPDANPGWTLSEDGKTVSKTYTGANSEAVLKQIYNDPLKLKFPGLKFEKDPDDAENLIAEMDNEVDLLATPSNMAEGESKPTAEDTLHFVITTDPSTDGSFTKQALKGNIYDTMQYKTNPYPWRIRLSNNKMQPLENIRIEDKKIPGENGLGGLDEALKFVKLESDWKDSVSAESKTVTGAVEKVIAYYTDGSKEEFYIKEGEKPDSDESNAVYVKDPGSKDDSLCNFTVEFNESKVCDGYDIIFKDDFKMQLNDAVSFKAYTVYRDPKGTVVPEGTDKITYKNSARSVNSYKNWKGNWEFEYLTVGHSYDMLPCAEKLAIGKSTYDDMNKHENRVGNQYRYWISLAGYLSEEKEYGKIYIVDLLPNEVDFVKPDNGSDFFEGGTGDSWYADAGKTGISATPKIEENYHNSGRTALIWEVPKETLKIHLESDRNNLARVIFQFVVKVREDAHPGTARNNIYIVGDNLDEYSGETGGTQDIYDLNNNGKTDDMIAWSHSDATIIAAEGIYAEKFIAPAGSNNWNKQGLSLKAGSEFDYKLKVQNGTDEEQTGLVVYDALPAINDKGILSNSDNRGSEFPVQLRGPITAPEGYDVYYTTDESVNGSTMKEMVDKEGIWTQSVSEWSAVTAFKLVATAETTLTKSGQPFEVRIPACVPTNIPEDSMKILEGKNYTDQTSGTTAYLQAINNFGYTTIETPNPKQSNSVWVRIPFAGFTIEKVDQKSKDVLQGATFMLTKTGDNNFLKIADSNEKGLLSFRDLTEGTYTLTETVVPDGYQNSSISLTVTITQDPNTGAYTVEFADSEGSKFKGTGTSSDPLIIENIPGYVLPKTGGVGIVLYTVGGILLAVVASFLMFIRRKRARA